VSTQGSEKNKRLRCQMQHPETGQCELTKGHEGKHLAGYMMWDEDREMRKALQMDQQKLEDLGAFAMPPLAPPPQRYDLPKDELLLMNLVSHLRRGIHKHKDEKWAKQASEYLERKGIVGNILRSSGEAAPPLAPGEQPPQYLVVGNEHSGVAGPILPSPAPPVQEPHATLNKDHFPALCPACTPPVQERETALTGEHHDDMPNNPASDWDDDLHVADENDSPDDCCVMCGKPLPIEGFCCEAECLEAAAGVQKASEALTWLIEWDRKRKLHPSQDACVDSLRALLATAAKQAEAATLLECSRAIGKPDDYFAGKEVRDCVAVIRRQAKEGAKLECADFVTKLCTHGDVNANAIRAWVALAAQPEQQKETK